MPCYRLQENEVHMLVYTYEWLDFEHYVFLFAADRLINVSTLSCWKKNRFFRLYQVISIDSRQWWSMCPAQQFLMQWQTPWAQEFHHMLRNNVSTVVLHFFQMVADISNPHFSTSRFLPTTVGRFICTSPSWLSLTSSSF